MMIDSKLTVIIPFLNEKYEVENTIKSINAFASNNVKILMINDASDDGYDYKAIAEKYATEYIENTERIGVAACRDKGVELCTTPYFLLLDAHMRFYDNLWVSRIITELELDDRALLCCQSKVLLLKDGLLTAPSDRGFSLGACIELKHEKELIHASWVAKTPHDLSQNQTIPIACVLGAGYACSKKYWQYLKGLNGLIYYGSDEPYISIKVWLEGGTCKLLTDVVAGHIYRTGSIPYNTEFKDRLYNQLLTVELLLPRKYKKKLFLEAKRRYPKIFPEVILKLNENRDLINELKNYYEKIFIRDFSFFEAMNNEYQKVAKTIELLVDGIDQTLSNIAELVQESSIEDIGIQNGKMGSVLYLFHYSEISGNETDKESVEKMLNEIITSIQTDIHYGFTTGLAGIGWGIQYLYEQGFVEGDINEILEDFDKRIMEINPERILNLNRDYGLGGLVCYILARLYTIERERLENPFDVEYLESVYNRVILIINERNTECDSIDLFLEFIDYYKFNAQINKPEINDICSMSNPTNIHLQDLPIGLNGVAGIGLKLIFEKEQDTINN